MAEMQSGTRGRVVVGVDDSDGSDIALEFAVREAACRHARLDIVHAYEHPTSRELPYEGTGGSTPDMRKLSASTEAAIRRSAAEAMAKSGVTDLDVDVTVRQGHPADVLLDAAIGADLLVVGSRGRGGFRSMLLGSVSRHCVLHATTPVTVVRHAHLEPAGPAPAAMAASSAS